MYMYMYMYIGKIRSICYVLGLQVCLTIWVSAYTDAGTGYIVLTHPWLANINHPKSFSSKESECCPSLKDNSCISVTILSWSLFKNQIRPFGPIPSSLKVLLVKTGSQYSMYEQTRLLSVEERTLSFKLAEDSRLLLPRKNEKIRVHVLVSLVKN